jgi:predicted protein tyrosine phosphatase
VRGAFVKRVLFVCSQNLLRSPTAEQVFARYPGIECTSAGLAKDTHNPVTGDLVEWADLIFVMEKVHRRKLAAKFKGRLKAQRVICLDIPDDYEFMDPALIELLEKKVRPFLPRAPDGG